MPTSLLVALFFLGGLAAPDLFEKAVAAFQEGRFDHVITLLEQLPAADAQRPASLNLRALALCELRRYDEALQSSRRACDTDPGNVNYVYNTGLIYITKGDYAAAERLFREALVRFPSAAKLYEGLGESLFRQFQFPEAAQAIQKAVELSPSSASAQVALAKLFHAVGNKEKFGPTAQRAIELDPESYLANYYYGLWLSEYQAQPAAAAEYLEKCTRLYPGFAPAWSVLARIQAGQGRWGEAVETYEKALALDAQNRQLYYQAATAYRKIGRMDKAEWAMKQFRLLEAGSDTPGRPRR